MTSQTLHHNTMRDTSAKWIDYVAIAKPRISLMVLLTVAVAGAISAPAAVPVWPLVWAMVGLTLISASGCALNQYLERYVDWEMPRTALRPLPRRRLSPTEVTVFGAITFGMGVSTLVTLVNWPTAVAGVLSWVIYVWIYTPLKAHTWLNTYVGAVAGAMPVLVGSTATRGHVTGTAWLLFGVLFLWQFPHFMAIAWLYRDDYRKAGLRMVSVDDPRGVRTAVHAVAFCLALIPFTFGAVAGAEGGLPIAWALVFALDAWYLAATVHFARRRDRSSAKTLFRVSIAYLAAYLVVVTGAALL